VLNDLGVGPTQVKKELQEWIGPVQRRHRRIGKGKSTDRTCSFCGCTDLGPWSPGPACGSAGSAP
jgi:hypothetical protein